ncbi:MAG: thioredoxin family protein, partial [Patescibacteria group bacterium]|nr:thioredoxin family protein [Patescibacteria group bacterium]
MMNIQTQKGFITPAIMALLVLAFVVGGALYFNSKPEAESMKKEGEAMMENITIAMKEANGSNQNGTVTITDENGKAKIVIKVAAGSEDIEQPSHIHSGSCPSPTPPPAGIVYPLSNTVNGMSETILAVSVEELLGKLPLSVLIHKSKTDAKTYVSCGDVAVSVMEKEGEAMMEKDGEAMMEKEGDAMMEKEGEAMMEDDAAMMKKEDGAMMAKYTGTVLAGSSAPLLEFNKADYDAAIASDKLVVLYFYANWCPVCKEETKNSLYPAFNELTTDKVVGIRVNYKDSDTDKDEENLARQFGVPYQHTKVFVKNGKQILKSPDGWDKARYITEIN